MIEITQEEKAVLIKRYAQDLEQDANDLTKYVNEHLLKLPDGGGQKIINATVTMGRARFLLERLEEDYE